MTTTSLTSYLALSLLSLLFVFPCAAQPALQDSLLARHLDESLSDTARLRALIALGETNYRKDSLLFYHQQSEALFEAKGTPDDVLEQTLQIGKAYFRTDQHKTALPLFIRAEEMAFTLQDTASLVSALFWQGNCYGRYFKADIAIEKYQEVLKWAKEVGDKGMIIGTNGNIAVQLIGIKEYAKAREYFQLCLDNAIKYDEKIHVLRSIDNIGITYIDEGKHSKALEYLLRALTMADEMNHVRFIPKVLSSLGECYLALGNEKEAKRSLDRGLTLARQVNSPGVITAIQLSLANFHQKTNPDSAIYQATQALNTAQKIGFLDFQASASELLFELYREQGNYPQAFEMQDQWKMLQDSINRAENQRAIYQVEARKEYEQQKLVDQFAQDQKLAQQELLTQRRTYIFLAVMLVIIIIFLSLLRYRRERSNQERRALLHQIELLKERVAVQSVSSTGVREELTLDKDRIEAHLGATLGESSWSILNIIFNNPSISNKELALLVFLSLDGLSSALRRMYKVFKVQTESSRNKKVALITKAVTISLA